MKKPNITPGEWWISRQVSTLVVGKTHDGYERSIASAGGYSRNTHDETPQNEANAKAISAVPKLIDALNSAKQYIENGIDLGYIIEPDSTDPALEVLPKIIQALRNAGVNKEE